ncbi:MAG: site-specific integrase, partial [Candidatus Sulfotelmatobacter sp.]
MVPDANSRVLSSFLDYLRIEKGLAPLSVSAYTTDVGQFAGFLEKHKRTLLTARRNEVREFLQQLFSNQVDGRSVGRKLSALRHLYRYLLLDKKIEHDPTLNIESPRQWKVLPKSLARDEMEATLAAPALRHTVTPAQETKTSAALATRDRAMLEVLYAGALRVTEIVSAKLEDLKLEAGYMLVRGKGDKERVVPLGKGAQDALTEYLAHSRPVLAAGKRRGSSSPPLKSSPLLFLARGAHKLTRQRVWQM